MIRILLADDHQMVIDGIKSMLHNTPGVTIVAEAINGQQALDQISVNPGSIDLVIADISMPLLSGTELCKQIKQHYPALQVLFLSMYNSAAAVKEAVAVEADGYILKSAGRDELLNAIHKIINGGTYFSHELVPLIYRQFQKEKNSESLLAPLSVREKEVLTLIVKELTSEEIATQLFISKKTVDNHRQSLLEKTNSKSTVGLVKFAIRAGLE